MHKKDVANGARGAIDLKVVEQLGGREVSYCCRSHEAPLFLACQKSFASHPTLGFLELQCSHTRARALGPSNDIFEGVSASPSPRIRPRSWSVISFTILITCKMPQSHTNHWTLTLAVSTTHQAVTAEIKL